MKKEISISFEEYSDISELPEEDQLLCLEAEKAMAGSYSPYSKFRVGAAVRLNSGTIVHGSNQENVAYPSGLCAERVALFSAGANYAGDGVAAIAITAHSALFELTSPVTSCGACLQVMAEFEKRQGHPFDIIFYHIGGAVIKIRGVRTLLPFMFDESRLQN